MTHDERLTPAQFIRHYGPANCWTGTVGTACCHIRDLLRENDCLHAHIDELTKELIGTNKPSIVKWSEPKGI